MVTKTNNSLRPMESKSSPARVLVVSEDDEFAPRVRLELESTTEILGCAGPLRVDCDICRAEACAFACEVTVALVDSPPSGYFKTREGLLSAPDYAVALSHRHPEAQVILCETKNLPDGEFAAVIAVKSRKRGIEILRELVEIEPTLGD